MKSRYAHLPPPPEPFHRVQVRSPRLPWALGPVRDDMPIDDIETYDLYLWRTLDTGGEEHLEVVSLTEYLWLAIQSHCHHACHTLHLSLRGAWRAAGRVAENDFNQALVELGNHSGQQIIVNQSEWADFVQELCVKLMPGWWTPPPAPAPLTYGGGIPAKEWRCIAEEISRLKPGECLFVSFDRLRLPGGAGWMVEALTQRTPIDVILESFVGSAYELTFKEQTGFIGKQGYLVRRLKKPVTSDHVRAYISPDRRSGWTHCPNTGLWHRKQ